MAGTFSPEHNGTMSDANQILSQIECGDPTAAEQLLPLVYDELRKLAAAKLAYEKPGQTLSATALVHEAYLRLVGSRKWEGKGHFFAAAAEAMRRTLVESARRKGRAKRGAGVATLDLGAFDVAAPGKADEVVAIDEALSKLETENAVAAQLVKLRYFAGFSLREAAEVLDVSSRKADQIWAYARAWLMAEIGKDVDR
jgi:RNA polymerase sigma factor (TIGR02999 family)